MRGSSTSTFLPRRCTERALTLSGQFIQQRLACLEFCKLTQSASVQHTQMVCAHRVQRVNKELARFIPAPAPRQSPEDSTGATATAPSGLKPALGNQASARCMPDLTNWNWPFVKAGEHSTHPVASAPLAVTKAHGKSLVRTSCTEEQSLAGI